MRECGSSSSRLSSRFSTADDTAAVAVQHSAELLLLFFMLSYRELSSIYEVMLRGMLTMLLLIVHSDGSRFVSISACDVNTHGGLEA